MHLGTLLSEEAEYIDIVHLDTEVGIPLSNQPVDSLPTSWTAADTTAALLSLSNQNL
jgi:hypothetical protein